MTTLQYKQELSCGIAARLDVVASVGSDVVHALAHRIKFCNQNQNLWSATDLHNTENGECFDGSGSLWSCSSRFCSHCVGKLSRRAAKIADYVYKTQNEKPIMFRDWRFIVLTMPDVALAGLSLARHHDVFYHAWRWLLTKSKFWKKKVKGTIKTEEFTLKANRENLYHFHGNVLAHGHFLNEKELKQEWAEALKLSFDYFNIKWACPTANGLPDVFLKRVVRRQVRDSETEIDRDGAISELCKYVTKPQDWQNIPASHLAEVAGMPRFFRAFELSGSCKQIAKAIRPKQQENVPEESETSEFETAGLIAQLNNNTYFNTKLITVPKNLCDSDISNNSPPKLRKKSWFLRLTNKEITLDRYKIELAAEIEHAQKFRKLQLRQKYGYCPTFFTLDGECF